MTSDLRDRHSPVLTGTCQRHKVMKSGYFDRSLNAYGREGLPCTRCGTTMVRVQFTNRSSTFCPRCQRLR